MNQGAPKWCAVSDSYKKHAVLLISLR
jgi:hypothetical protein